MKLITARETRERFAGISAMTEHRRRRGGLLPPALSISGRKYDPEPDIDAIQAAYAAGASDAEVRGLVAEIVAKREAA